jgi:stage II sporulation protein AA (anti-sigma F factor antagonist)
MIRPMEERPPDGPQLAVTRSEQDGVQLIELAGEVDLDSVDELDAVLATTFETPSPRVCLDLGELAFIDSSGLAAVIRAHLAASAAGGSLVIVSSAGAVRRTFETSGVMDMLNVVDDRTAALAELA